MEAFWTIFPLTVCIMESLLVNEVSGTSFLEKVCLQPSDEGKDCGGAEGVKPQTMYAFSEEKEECIPLEYKGCGGNDNRFKKQDDCTDSCQIDYFKRKNKKGKRKNADLDSDEERTLEDCKEPKMVGSCRALIPMWYYDEETKNCEPFNYGGCKGTRNRFDTDKLCKETCLGKKE